jgi:hypothetical protein
MTGNDEKYQEMTKKNEKLQEISENAILGYRKMVL